ncbi:2'-5' RNA ligase family protein [Micromonospora sp. NPDC007208]|uniref:2'-5' RNA ligase family protein n=1 Tax=Micromonospora sp. NPDC007208 TaxID=3364236 RepID=UPI00368967E6
MTVLYAFLSPQQIDEQVLAVLRETIAGTPRFDVALTDVGWFGDTVVWLAPQPSRPFRELTSAVWQQFPEAPPMPGRTAMWCRT